MNEDRPLQLNLPPPKYGVQTVTFKGPSSREHLSAFKSAIDAQLYRYTDIRRIIFDMAAIHPHINAAGRILDLACEYKETRQLSIEVRIPAKIYELLHFIESDKMPKPTGKKPVHVRGVSVVVLSKTAEAQPGELERHFASSPTQMAEPVTLARWEGRISDVNGSTITVSLDTEEGEVVAEFDRIQFPKGPLTPGMLFEYRATVAEPGTTNIHFDPIPAQQATDEELKNEEAMIRKELPGLERLDA